MMRERFTALPELPEMYSYLHLSEDTVDLKYVQKDSIVPSTG